MAATTFEDRLDRMAREIPPPREASGNSAPRPSSTVLLFATKSEPTLSPIQLLGVGFMGMVLGVILGAILNISMLENSPWGPGTEMADFVLLPALAMTGLLLAALIPAVVFVKRAPQGAAFVGSALTVMVLGFIV